MSEFTDFLQFLYSAGESIIPWLIVSLVAFIVVHYRDDFGEYLQSKKKVKDAEAEAKLVVAQIEGERLELTRNNLATLEMCQQFLQMYGEECSKDTDEMTHHEQLSAERMERIQLRVDEISAELGRARGDIGILLDRRAS